MKAMKTSILCLLILLSSSTLMAQGKLQWSTEHKIDGQKRIVAVQDGSIYLQRSLRGYFQDSDYVSDLSKYDASGQLTHVIPVENLENRSYQEIAAVNTDMGIAIIYLSTHYQDDKYLLLAAQLYSHADLSPLEVIDLKKIKYTQGAKSTIRDYRDNNGLADIEITYSADRSKLAVSYVEERVGNDRYSKIDFSVYSLDNKLTEVNTGIIRTEERSDKYQLQDISVNNRGDLAYLMKEYKDNRNIEFVDKRPGYRYSLYYFPKGRTEFIYDIPSQQYYIDNMQVVLDDEGMLYTNGMVREKPSNDIYGTFTTKVDTVGIKVYENTQLYSKREIKKIRGKEKRNIRENYDILDMLIEGDKLYAVYEYYDIRREGFNDPRFMNNGLNRPLDFVDYAYKEDILLHGLSTATGDRLWTTVLPKRTSDFDAYEQYTTGNMWLHDGSIYLLSNETEGNLTRVKEGKNPRGLDLPGRTAVLLLQKVTPDGQADKTVLKEQDRYLIMNEGSLMVDNALYLLVSHRNDRNFKLSIAPLR